MASTPMSDITTTMRTKGRDGKMKEDLMMMLGGGESTKERTKKKKKEILKGEEKEEEESIGPKQTQGILSERETCFLEIETFFF
jgi:hypothetical protein